MTHQDKKQLSSHISPFVSIGLPVYNGEQWVARAIESILAQTYPNFELVISDNASSDGTSVICKGYADRDPRIRYIRQPSNIGATNNFRFVLHEARHDRFIWTAADDWWDKDRLEKLVNALGPDDAVVVGSIRRYVDDLPFAEYTPVAFDTGQWWRFIMREESRCEKVYYIYGLMWKKYALLCFETTVDGYGEDVLFCYRLLWRGNLKSVSGATLHSTAHQSSTGASLARSFRYSIARAIYRAHPWSYYKKYIDATPKNKRLFVTICIPIKAVVSSIHLWWRAFRRLVLGRPYVHGAVRGGETLVKKAGL